MPGQKFSNKNLLINGAIAQRADYDTPAIFIDDSSKIQLDGVTEAEGLLVGTLGTLKNQEFSWIYTADFGGIAPAGTLTSTAALNASAAVEVGDWACANPVGSVNLNMIWNTAIYSAGAVNLRATYLGSGVYDAGAIPFRIVVKRYA